MRHALIILCLCLCGCAGKVPKGEGIPPAVIMSDFGPLNGAYASWVKEVKRRFPHDPTLVIFCHGNVVKLVDEKGRVLDKKWVLFPDSPRYPMLVQDFADAMHIAYPKHIKILIVCNPGGLRITTPRTYFALADVWIEPDRFCGIWYPHEKKKGHGSVGDIDEFECATER